MERCAVVIAGSGVTICWRGGYHNGRLRLSAFGFRLSALGFRLSAFGFRLRLSASPWVVGFVVVVRLLLVPLFHSIIVDRS